MTSKTISRRKSVSHTITTTPTATLVAMVGAHKPATAFDAQCIIKVISTVGKRWPLDPDYDVINLCYGRDFLAEDRKYEAVLVHSVFHTNEAFLDYAKESTELGPQISPHHQVDKWRERLVGTEARIIAVVEALPFSLSGWHLNDLPGYLLSWREHTLTVYEKMP